MELADERDQRGGAEVEADRREAGAARRGGAVASATAKAAQVRPISAAVYGHGQISRNELA